MTTTTTATSNEITPVIYAFYNNKGGVGKTTLCCNVAAVYAENNPNTQVLLIDMCPQANASHFFLGGGKVGHQVNQQIQTAASRKNIVGFIDWLMNGGGIRGAKPTRFGISVHAHNKNIPENMFLIAGDSFLESYALGLSYAVINPMNTEAWREYMEAILSLCNHEFQRDVYENMTVFIDCNPSFSIYTQMALVSAHHLIIPMMADYSSAEGIRSVFTLLYGTYPSAALQKYAQNVLTFSKQMTSFKLEYPSIFEFVFNNFTTNLGVAMAFDAIKHELAEACFEHYQKFPEFFVDPPHQVKSAEDFSKTFISDIKDFHTAGKVSASLGIPMHKLSEHQTKFKMPDGTIVSLPRERYTQAVTQIKALAAKIP